MPGGGQMAAIELADAWVSIVPSLKGAEREIAKQLGGMDFSGAGRSVGSSMASGLGKALKVGGVAVAGAAAAGIGVAITKGLGRLAAIDNATAKMQGLGFAAKDVDALMANALESVKGTAFGLGDAATVASQFAAAGIGPGEEMTRLLSSVASNAAAAGVELSDMGSVFAKAATQANGVQNDVISQLADKGIPIYQSLADVMGVTAGEVFKLASEGKINFDQFAEAAENAAGDVAAAMGGTVSGSLDNFFASMGRIGANALGGVFNSLAPAIQGVTSALGPLEDVAGSFGDKVGKVVAPALENMVDVLNGDVKLDWLERVSGIIGPVASEVSGGVRAMVAAFQAGDGDLTSAGFAGVLEAVGNAARAVWDSGLVELASPIGLLFNAITAAGPGVYESLTDIATVLVQGVGAVLPALIPLLGAFVSILTTALPVILPSLLGIVDGVAQVLGGIFNWVGANPDLTSTLVVLAGAVGAIVVAVRVFRAVQLGLVAATYGVQGAMLVAGTAAKVYGVLMKGQAIATGIATAAQKALNLAFKANPIGLIITAITALVAGLVYFFTQTELGQEIWAGFMQFLTDAWNNIAGVAEAVWGGISSFFTGLWEGLVAGFTAAWNAITGVFQQVADFLAPVINFIGGLISTNVEIWKGIFLILAAVLVTIWRGISNVVMTVWNAIVGFLTPIIDGIVSFITTAFTAFVSFWSGVWDGISAVFTTVWNGIVAFFQPIIDGILSVVTTVVSAIQSVWNGTWENISSFFSGVWQGMSGAVSGAVGEIAGFVGGIWDTVMGALGDVGGWLLDAGGDLIRGFWEGILGMGDWLLKKITGFFDGAVGWAKDVLGINSPSRVFMQIGEYTGEGMALGLQSTRSDVDAAMGSMLSIPDAPTLNARSINGYELSSNAAAQASGPAVQMTVESSPGMDEEVIGQVAAERINFALRG